MPATLPDESTAMRNKVVLVTGSTRGIGKAMAVHFGTLGARVCVTGRSIQRGERVAEEIRSTGNVGTYFPCDVSSEGAVAALFDHVTDLFGPVDAVINNAAATDVGTRDRPIVMQTTEDFDYFIHSCLHSVFWSFKYGIPAMGDSGGSFVTISSIAAETVTRGLGSYAAAKAAATALSRQVAVEYGDRNIRANVLTLGFIETNASTRLLDAPEFGSRIRGATGGHPPTSLDVARAASFLASDSSYGFNGATLVLDRGMMALSQHQT